MGPEESVLQEAKVPVYLYNFPANVNTLISADLYSTLAKEFPQLKGIKNTFDDLPLSKTFKEKVPHGQVKPYTDISYLEINDNKGEYSLCCLMSTLRV